MTEAAYLRRLYWCSFALRVFIGMSGWFLTRVVNIPFLQDALYYEAMGAEVAEAWLAGEPSAYLETAIQKRQPWLIVVILAVCYYPAGGARITPLAIAFTCSITSFAPGLTYRIGKQLGAPLAGARAAGWLVAASPAFAFWSGALYKEGFILVLMNLAIYHILILQEKWQPTSIVVLVLTLLGLFALRFYLAVIMGGVLMLGMLLGKARETVVGGGAEALVRQVVLSVFFFLGMIAVGFTDQVQELMPGDLAGGLGQMQTSRRGLAISASSGYLAEAKIDTAEDALHFLPVGVFYFVTVPWPWQVGSFRQNLCIPETAVWVFLIYPMILVGIKEGLRKNFQGTMLLLVGSLTITCFYGMWISNIGAAYRLRIQVWVLWAVFAGWGWAAWRQGRATAAE
jgi:hypothetical protein